MGVNKGVLINTRSFIEHLHKPYDNFRNNPEIIIKAFTTEALQMGNLDVKDRFSDMYECFYVPISNFAQC